MSRNARANSHAVQKTTAGSVNGATKRRLSIPKRGEFFVVLNRGDWHLCLHLFTHSNRDSPKPTTYAVKTWNNNDGFFTETTRFYKSYCRVERFNDFDEAMNFYKGVI